MARRPRAGLGFALLFVSFWSLLTLGFDSFIAYSAWRQVAASGYPSTPGAITESRTELQPGGGSDGPTWSAEISFRYTVAGREYTSDRWRYGAVSTSDQSVAQRVSARYPVGSQVSVRYNPRDPGDAVLVVGTQGMDAFLALFMTPFNAVMLGGWIILAGLVGRVGPFAPRPLGVPVWEQGGETRLRLIGLFPPSFAGLAAAGLAGFFAIFIIGFTVGMDPPSPLAGGVWLGCVSLGIVVYAVVRARLAAGKRDLRIDPVRRVLILPPRLAKGGEAEVPFEAVTAVKIAPGSVAANGRRSSWRVVIRRHKGRAIRLVELRSRPEVVTLAEWLRDVVGCRTPGNSPGPIAAHPAATAPRP